MTKEQKEMFKSLPEREKAILVGMFDESYQAYNIDDVKKTYGKCSELNDVYNRIVAEKLGFSDYSTFFRLYKKEFGYAPSHYEQKSFSKHQN